jgi:TatD DNase family protein
MMRFTDTHAHLYEEKFKKDFPEILDRAAAAGVTDFFIPNVNHESIDGMLEIELAHAECKPMMGLHPCYVDKNFEKELYIVEDWLNKRKFWAVGEIGLDLYWDKTFFEQQKEAFSQQIEWAKKFKIPIAVHSRNANKEALETVKKHFNKDLRGIFHCFSGTIDEAKELVTLGFYLGVGGVVTYKNGGLDQILPHIPLENIVLETDCPYLAPVPHKGKRNEPSFVPIIAAKTAEIYGKTAEEIAEMTTKNAQKLFNF